jgi:uncharacterized protein
VLSKSETVLFVIIGHDGPNGANLRLQFRSAHLRNLRRLAAQGRLVIAGPFTDGEGSLIVADFDNEADATTFAQNDPYTTGGVFERVEVKPFVKSLPE